MTGPALRVDAPRLLVAGVLVLPLTLAVLLVVPARSTSDFWTGLAFAPGLVGVLVTVAVLTAAVALTHSRALGRTLDATLFLAIPVIAAMTLWAYSVPGSYFFVSIMLFFVWILLAIVWIGRFGFVLARRQPTTREIAAWLALPVLVVATAAAVLADAPFKARYELSRPAMDRAAQSVLAGHRDPAAIEQIGLWEVDRAEKVPGGFRFLVKETGFLDPVGFAYSPHGAPPYIGEDSYWHLEGAWYVWEESW